MNVVCKSPFQSEITLKEGRLQIVGSVQLIEKMNAYKNKLGSDPQKWTALESIKTSDDLLMNEFIPIFTKCFRKALNMRKKL